VKFDVHTSNFEDAFRRFLLLESSGWKGANKSAIASDQVTARFYNAAFERLHSRGCVRMYSLSAGDKVIAMQLGVVMNGVYYVPKSAYNEEFSSYSPGQLLNLHVIGDLAANGFHTYDFLGPKALWKMVWAPTTRDHHNCYIFRPSVKGRILHALTMRAAKAARAVRHRVWGDPQALFASTFW
jgi:CelD/BcsL family acetyltransferase involved in cellulose biosynthesis